MIGGDEDDFDGVPGESTEGGEVAHYVEGDFDEVGNADHSPGAMTVVQDAAEHDIVASMVGGDERAYSEAMALDSRLLENDPELYEDLRTVFSSEACGFLTSQIKSMNPNSPKGLAVLAYESPHVPMHVARELNEFIAEHGVDACKALMAHVKRKVR